MNKKAQGHVEVVISFVIFIGFLFFIFLVFNPFQQSANPKLVDFVFNKLDDRLSVEMSQVSFNLDIPQTQCFEILDVELFNDLNCRDNNLIVEVKSPSGIVQKINTNKIFNGFQIDFLPGAKFYTIYCAPDLEESSFSPSTCNVLNSDDYSLGIINDKKVWSESKLVELTQSYDQNYNGMKRDISGRDDFGLSLLLPDSDVDIASFGGVEIKMPAEDKNIQGVNVFVNVIPVDVLGKDAKISRYKAKISVW
jgi:hypothetical protein